jgi:hypothetical protein
MKPTVFLVALASALALLQACGAGDEPAASGAAAGESEPARLSVVSPLLHDDGSVMPTAPSAAPADPGARTRLGWYASRAQASQMSSALGSDVIHLQVQGTGAQALELDVAVAWGLQAAGNLSNDAPVLVSGTDLRQAAAVANRLIDAGMTRVFLVVG